MTFIEDKRNKLINSPDPNIRKRVLSFAMAMGSLSDSEQQIFRQYREVIVRLAKEYEGLHLRTDEENDLFWGRAFEEVPGSEELFDKLFNLTEEIAAPSR